MIFNMQSGGVVPDQYLDAQTITPGASDQVINAGTYLRGAQTIKGDPDLIPGNIKAGVNLFGVLGTLKQEGLYAWKKSNYQAEESIANPYFNGTFGGSGTYPTLTITAANFDINKVKDWVSFLDGFAVSHSTSGVVCKFTKSGDSLYFSYYASSGLNGPVTISTSGDSVVITLNGSYNLGTNSNTYTSQTAKIITPSVVAFLDYIVSDNENAYPNGAVHSDGYYYEKVKAEIKTEIKVVTGSFTGAYYVTEYTINHNGNMDITGVYISGTSGAYSQYLAVLGSAETGFTSVEVTGNGDIYSPTITIIDENTFKIKYGNSYGPGRGSRQFIAYGIER